MFAPISQMPSTARVWVYQSSRELNNDEENKILTRAKDFIETWTAHSQELKASFEIRNHLFLIFFLNENHASASGCSIDKSVHFIQQIEKEFSLSLMDRLIFAFKENEKIRLVKRGEFESLISSGKISNETIVFNNLIQTKKELESNWAIPLKDSWHKKQFAL